MVASTRPPEEHQVPFDRGDWFYMWIGLCLTRWGYVEDTLFNLCALALETPNKRMAAIVFYRTPSFDARLSLCDELLEAALPKEHWMGKEWDATRLQLLEQSPIRNALAHYHPRSAGFAKVVMPKGGGPGRIASSENWMEVNLSPGEQLRGRNKKIIQVKDVEMPTHYISVEGLLKRLRTLEKALRQKPLPEFPPSNPAHTPET